MFPKTTVLFFLLSTSEAVIGAHSGPRIGGDRDDDATERYKRQRLDLCEVPPGEREVFVYVFNLTNPEGFLSSKTRLPHIGEFAEIGPFVFKETVSRKDCWISPDDSSVNFEMMEEKQLESPQGDLDVLLTTVNIAFAWFGRFVLAVESMPTSLKGFIEAGEGYLRNGSMSTVKDLLLDGYDISMMNAWLRGQYSSNLTELQHDRFEPFQELLYPQSLRMLSDPDTFGQVVAVDGEKLDVESCNFARATDGAFFPGSITTQSVLNFYSEDLCSIIPIVFKEALTYKNLRAFKFVFSANALQVAACDCKDSADYPDDVKTCFPRGGVDVKTCQKNLPYIATIPHFLRADPKYTEVVSGMKPSEDLHQSYFLIEPVTGQVLESSLKFQLNVNLLQFKYEYIIWKGIAIQDTIFPLFWTEKKFTLSEQKVLEIQNFLEELTQTTTEKTTPTTITTTAEHRTKGTTTVRTTKTPESTITTSAPSFANEATGNTVLHRISDLSKMINMLVYLIYAVISIAMVGFMYTFFFFLHWRSR